MTWEREPPDRCARAGRVAGAGLAGAACGAAIATLVAPRTIAQHEQADAQVQRYAALGFPLELPTVPGYQPDGAYPSADGALVVDMQPDGSTTFSAAISYPPVSDSVLIQAVSALRPATAADIAGLN